MFCLNRVKGGDLFTRLRDEGAFSEEAGKKLFKQLLDAVGYLHSNNVTHRDLKVCSFLFLLILLFHLFNGSLFL